MSTLKQLLASAPRESRRRIEEMAEEMRLKRTCISCGKR